MTWLLKPSPVEDIYEGDASPGSPSNFAENFLATADAVRRTDALSGERVSLNDARQENRSRIEQFTGQPYLEAIRPFLPSPADFEGGIISGTSAGQEAAYVAEQELAYTLPEAQRSQILTKDMLAQRGQEIALEKTHTAEEIVSRSRGFSDSYSGATLGEFGGVMADPVNIASLFVGAPAATGVLRFALTEAFINASVEGISQPWVQSYREKLGLPSGWQQGVENVLVAGLAGGVLSGGALAIFKGFSRLTNRELAQAADDILPDRELSVERNLTEQLDAIDADNPSRGHAGGVQRAETNYRATGRATEGEIETPQRVREDEISKAREFSDPASAAAKTEADLLEAALIRSFEARALEGDISGIKVKLSGRVMDEATGEGGVEIGEVSATAALEAVDARIQRAVDEGDELVVSNLRAERGDIIQQIHAQRARPERMITIEEIEEAGGEVVQKQVTEREFMQGIKDDDDFINQVRLHCPVGSA